MSLLPPLDRTGKPFLGIKFEYASEGDQAGTIEIEDNCAGAFVTYHFNNQEGLSFIPDELLAIEKWAKKLCDEVTEFNGTGQK
jgi:hypothetical protein